jgi:hypothetical protein
MILKRLGFSRSKKKRSNDRDLSMDGLTRSMQNIASRQIQ